MRWLVHAEPKEWHTDCLNNPARFVACVNWRESSGSLKVRYPAIGPGHDLVKDTKVSYRGRCTSLANCDRLYWTEEDQNWQLYVTHRVGLHFSCLLSTAELQRWLDSFLATITSDLGVFLIDLQTITKEAIHAERKSRYWAKKGEQKESLPDAQEAGRIQCGGLS